MKLDFQKHTFKRKLFLKKNHYFFIDDLIFFQVLSTFFKSLILRRIYRQFSFARIRIKAVFAPFASNQQQCILLCQCLVLLAMKSIACVWSADCLV